MNRGKSVQWAFSWRSSVHTLIRILHRSYRTATTTPTNSPAGTIKHAVQSRRWSSIPCSELWRAATGHDAATAELLDDAVKGRAWHGSDDAWLHAGEEHGELLWSTDVGDEHSWDAAEPESVLALTPATWTKLFSAPSATRGPAASIAFRRSINTADRELEQFVRQRDRSERVSTVGLDAAK